MKNKHILLIISLLLLNCCAFAQTSEHTLREMLNLINQDSIKRTVQDMQDFESRLCNKTVGQNRKVAQYLVDRLKAYNIENARIDSFYVSGLNWVAGTYDQYMYNVIGTLKGTGNTDSTVIIGAHLDAISYLPDYTLTPTAPGADDNATGCAVMIETARIIFENNLKPYHNIDFMAYDAEEIGLLGARYDADKRKNANEKIIVMLNNDMVGYQPQTEEYAVTLYWYDNALDVTEKARQALINYTTVTPYIPLADENESMNDRSDSWAYFLNDFKATLALEYYFFLNQTYHRVDDIVENVNFDYCKEIAKMNFVLLADYSKINFAPNAIPYYSENNRITVFPNPTTGQLIIDNGQLIIENVELFDIYGRKQKIILNSQFSILNSIDVSHLSSGVYFVRIDTDKEIVTKKIIKQ